MDGHGPQRNDHLRWSNLLVYNGNLHCFHRPLFHGRNLDRSGSLLFSHLQTSEKTNEGVRQRKFIIMACALALFALGLYSFFQGEILIGASWLVAGVLALLLVLMVKGFHDFNQP